MTLKKNVSSAKQQSLPSFSFKIEEAIADLLVYSSREEALAKLEAILPEQGIEALRTAFKQREPFTGPSKEGEGLARHACKFMGHAMYNQNPASPVQRLKSFHEYYLQPLFQYRPGALLLGKNVLELGAGVANPLPLPVLARLHGARKIFAYEPAPVNMDMCRFCLKEFFSYLLFENTEYKSNRLFYDRLLSLVKEVRLPENAEGPLCEITPEIYLYSGAKIPFKEYTGFFDYIFSTSVLEHVDGLEKELGLIHAMLRPGGVAIHVVDFSDHRFEPGNPIGLFLENMPPSAYGLNGLRFHELEALFGKLRLKHNLLDIRRTSLSVEQAARLKEKYPGISLESLSVIRATFAITR